MSIDIEDYNNIKNDIEDEIRQLKLKLYEKQFRLSEIKNIIRKNCIHEWEHTDIEMGHSSFSENVCKKCNITDNSMFDNYTNIF